MLSRKWVVLGLAAVLLALVAWPVSTKLKKDHDRAERYREGIRDLRERYPFESLESRLPPPPALKREQLLSQEAAAQLQKFESSISNENEGQIRDELLQKLHEGSVEEFVRREGFGVSRMFESYAESVLALGHQKDDGTWVGRNKTSVPQPSSAFSLSSRQLDLEFKATLVDALGILDLHLHNTLHFVNPAGFGAMKNRRNVAGFQAHQFNQLIEEKPWKITRIELVGLLLEDRPRVYVTETLPRMQDMRGVPTRSPDAFESAGLERLLGGDELYIRDLADGIRMLGAIRSAQQCIKCHGGERGALLGTFSYGLRREP
jgi:hypothetical protein